MKVGKSIVRMAVFVVVASAYLMLYPRDSLAQSQCTVTARDWDYLAQSTDGMDPPISIRIQDFWGGVVVGLLSIPLSRWIGDQISAEGPETGG